MEYLDKRLTDLSNAQASKLLKKLHAALDKINSDEEIKQVKEDLGLNDNLFRDLIELMILKGGIEFKIAE